MTAIADRPRLTRDQIDPAKVYIAWQGFSARPLGVAREQELRGSDPRVREHPQNFVELGTPREEWPTPLDHVIAINTQREQERRERERRKFEEAAKRNKRRVETKVARATRDIICRYEGVPAMIVKGSTLPADDPVVLSNLEAFRL